MKNSISLILKLLRVLPRGPSHIDPYCLCKERYGYTLKINFPLLDGFSKSGRFNLSIFKIEQTIKAWENFMESSNSSNFILMKLTLLAAEVKYDLFHPVSALRVKLTFPIYFFQIFNLARLQS